MVYSLVETVTVGSGGTSSISFTNIPQTGNDLLILFSGRVDVASLRNVSMQFNGSTANFSSIVMEGVGSTVEFGSQTNLFARAVQATTNTFSNTYLYVTNYTSSTDKTFVIETTSPANDSNGRSAIYSGRWANSAAITSIALTVGDLLVQNTTASLYLIDSDNATGATPTSLIPKATGGTITLSGGFFYHTFTGSGTFTPTQSITADILVVAGGGGGGGTSDVSGGAGGGAGGYAAYGSQALLAQNYTVTVGAGGSGGVSDGNNRGDRGGAGTNSSFGVLTAAVGGGGGGGSGSGMGPGGNGGSGGGGQGAGGTGTAGQGNSGGTGFGGGTSGGGGGASAAGANGGSGSGGGGGNGTTWLNGSAYAGGGGSGQRSSGTTRAQGGTGGGGAGGWGSTVPNAGTANTGGGGGGSGAWDNTAARNGAAGGSGIVIVRYAA